MQGRPLPGLTSERKNPLQSFTWFLLLLAPRRSPRPPHHHHHHRHPHPHPHPPHPVFFLWEGVEEEIWDGTQDCPEANTERFAGGSLRHTIIIGADFFLATLTELTAGALLLFSRGAKRAYVITGGVVGPDLWTTNYYYY